MSLSENQLTISQYRELIKNLPYLDQAFETKRATWKREVESNVGFRKFCDQAFKGNTLKLSRADLFAVCKTNVEKGLFAIILWGYPRGMRGSIFLKIINALPNIIQALSVNKELSIEGFASVCNQLSGTGIGLSTLTKILYFLNYTLERHQCIILDQRIIDVLNNRIFLELLAFPTFTDFNKKAQYIQYLKRMEELAQAEGYTVDQLELFLFQFGKNLKQTVASSEVLQEV